MSARPVLRTLMCALAAVLLATPSFALQRTWIGGNVDWVDGGSTANWTPADEPDADDEAIFNTSNGVNLGSNNAVNGLTMSGGIDLNTNGFDLTVDGLVQLSGASTNLFIGGAAGSVDADDVVINSGGTVELTGGTLVMDEEAGTALIDLNAGGTLSGNGLITFNDNPGVATLMLVNDGTLTALSRAANFLLPPPVGTLTISDVGVNGRIDLDGSGEAGVVNVNRNQTLSIEMPLLDTFNGTLNLFHNSTYQTTNVLQIGAGATITIDNGFIDGGIFADTPADTAFFKGTQLSQTGGVINVADTDGTFQIDGIFTMTGGSFTNSGTVIFNGTTTITTAAGYDPTALDAKTIINANFTVNDAAGNFDWDGNGQSDTTVNGSAQLTLNVNQVDTTDNVFGGTLTLNDSADATVNVAATSWTVGGSLVKNGAGTSAVSGDAVNVTGGVSVNAGLLSMPTTTLAAGANVNVSGRLTLGSSSVLAGATITGTGELEMTGTSTVTANTTVSTAIFDWDGVGTGTTQTINSGVVFTINSPTFDNDGDMDDPINLFGNGSLIVNGPASWTMNGIMSANVAGIGVSTIGGSSRVVFANLLNVNAATILAAPTTFGPTANVIINSATTLRLTGGNTTDNVNRIEGGVIDALGILSADAGKALEGFGTINTDIDFDGASNLFADDGMLTINAPILDVNRIGTADADGVLNVVNAWNTNVAGFVNLRGGTLQGGTVTIDGVNGMTGFGLVTARVINNQLIRSTDGDLVLQTSGNDNDWDGAANNGDLLTDSHTLELRDNATFGFGGTASILGGGRIFANGFALDFNPGSALNLNANGTYESTSSTDFGGTVTTSAGPASRIKVQNNFFLTFESTSQTTLVANLELQNNNINIEAGATFSGTGALIIDEPSHAVLDNGAVVNVLLVNEGTIRPGNFDGIGTATVKDYVQTDAGELFVELTGALPNQYDRILVSQTAQLDGYLNIDLDGGFNPTLGTTFDIISSAFGVSGTFDTIDYSGLPAGKTFAITYLPNTVRLTTVVKPEYAADFDDDGDVDATDYLIWTNAYALNQLGDATGDNISDAADYTVWRDTLGSGPSLPSVAIPEPTAAILIALASGLPLMSRRR